jgi:hypothetical protein
VCLSALPSLSSFLLSLTYPLLSRDRCEGFSGADLAGLLREAGTAALRRLLQGKMAGMEAKGAMAQARNVESSLLSLSMDTQAPLILNCDFEVAFRKVFPSVSKRDLARYRSLQYKLRASTSHLAAAPQEPAKATAAEVPPEAPAGTTAQA